MLDAQNRMMKSGVGMPLQALLAMACVCGLNANAATNILDIQKDKFERVITGNDPNSDAPESVKFMSINPAINAWYLVSVKWRGQKEPEIFHIENPRPKNLFVDVDPAFGEGLILTGQGPEAKRCSLWATKTNAPIRAAKSMKRYYEPICDGALFVRNPSIGRESTKEVVTDFLRRHVWGGEQITSIVKDTIFKDKFLITGDLKASDGTVAGNSGAIPEYQNGPGTAQIQPNLPNKFLIPDYLGIDLGEANALTLEAGSWYPAKRNAGVYVSIIEPMIIKSEILNSFPQVVHKLDATEEKAIAYLVAFDLSKHELGFALGTKHPSLEWSERADDRVRSALPGPDGFAVADPLVVTGGINPIDATKVIATFTGGFKRSHGAFKWGELASINRGSHYGFIENGVVFSRLVPGLATVIIFNDGRVDMRTWRNDDNALLKDIRHARQNGVAIIDWDEQLKAPVPGRFVGSWHLGNWSGSQDSAQRALRAGACLQENQGRQYLIYGYFSGATANSMARVFQSYGCRYALHLDMNALEHTYLALYSSTGKDFGIQYLITGMNVLDREVNGAIIPRFVGTPDNRDFFFVMKK